MALWIKLSQGVHRHRKIIVLARILDISRMAAVGHMTSLWLWGLDNAQDGDLSRLTEMEVAIAAEWREDDGARFRDAMQEAGLLDPDGGIHNWHDYAGVLIDRRRAEAQRKRTSRAGQSAGRGQDINQGVLLLAEPPATTGTGNTGNAGNVSAGRAQDITPPDSASASRPADWGRDGRTQRREEKRREEQIRPKERKPSPRWTAELANVAGFKKDEHQESLLLAWVWDHGFTEEHMMKVVEAMVSKVKAKQYTNLYSAVKTWARNEDKWNVRDDEGDAQPGSGQSPRIEY